MGLFHTFVASNAVDCPRCQSPRIDWQSKDGVYGMNTYRPGDEMDFEDALRTRMEVHEICVHCGLYIRREG